MTRIYNTSVGILQQKKSGKTTLVTKRETIEVKIPRKVKESNAEEIAQAILHRQDALDE